MTSSPAGRASGVRRGLTNYGDAGFSLFLRRAIIKGAGYSDEALDKPTIGIINTGSGFNPCHGTPEFAVGGPLRLVRTGDTITLSVSRRLLHLEVSAQELARREDALGPPPIPVATRGYRKLYVSEVTQADEGCDFRFLQSTELPEREAVQKPVGEPR